MAALADALVAWFEQAGRQGLPWQQNPSPYRVWVSEVMLQQTQVTTVIPYFERFVARFPDVPTLAAAPLDEVLAHWSGLGYYSRARHLHRAAQQIVTQHDGVFPQQLEAVMALPGIGRSTAGAILALACGQSHPILDGNVKRVLSRYHAVAGWAGQPGVERQLWALAQAHMPQQRVAAYTQAIMDLGALVCTRNQPRCDLCPLAADCQARSVGTVRHYPAPRPRKVMPVRQTRMLLLIDSAGAVLLQRRPPKGLWGGLWSLPECPPDVPVVPWCRTALGVEAKHPAAWPVLRHTFTHFHLDITPVRLHTTAVRPDVMAAEGRVWYKSDSSNQLGLPAPVARLLERLATEREEQHR